MKNFFLLIHALTLAAMASAATINITPTSYSSTPLNQAVDAANANDTIVLAAGTYVETSGSGYINFDKNVVIKAADEAEVIIDLRVPMTIQNGARAEISGLKFDATHLYQASWYTHIIYADDVSENNRLILEGCEFYNDTIVNSVIYCASSKKLDSCIVNNCKFHDIARSCMFFENTDMLGVSVTNSTFYNITNPRNYYSAGVIDLRGASTKLRVDHCTFYNVQVINTDYAAIGNNKVTISDGIVSNCIFAMPSSTNNLRAIRNVTTANNCLVYNYEYDSNWGIHSTVTKNSCIQLKDPLFNDLANNKFTYDGDWTTMSISPARGAATDGSDLGDPRWHTAETLPTTNFASDYELLGTKALLSGRIGLNGSDHIAYIHNSTTADGTAKWKLHVNKSCYISAVADREAGNSVGCQLTLTVKDAEGNTVGSPLNAAASYNDNDIQFPGTIFFPEAGDYTLILTNSTLNSTAVLEKITLSYFGGAVQNISSSANTTLNVADAWYNTGGTRADGKVSYSSWSSGDSWIKWNIATSETKFYNLTLRISTTNAHHCAVAIYEDENADPVASISESYSEITGDALDLELGRISLVGGKNYVVKVTNPVSGSAAKIASLTFAPVVATTTSLPNTLAFANTILSDRAHFTDGKLYFAPIGDSNPVGEWARWSVTTDHAGRFLFTMGVNSDNSQSYKISILDNSDHVVDFCDLKTNTGEQTLKHYFQLAAGNYSVKVENTYAWSHGYLTSLVVTEPNDVITIDEAATENTSWSAKVNDGNSYDVQIIRTIKAGMYNTFCLPFEVSSDMCKAVFGLDVQIRTLEEASIEDDFVLTLNFKTASDIYPGTPVLIQTSRDIVNPVFTGVKFIRETPSATTKTNANFTGTFVKTALEPDVNILFLGANNKLFFPTASVDMYGMRGWFVIHGSGGGAAPAVRSARIVENGQVATEIELVKEQPSGIGQKILENGQLIIIRDGVRYNAMGVKLQ